ncbi:MAG TPA: hypothetical protein VGE45_11850 [Chloroflexia bacterium]|jgi:hypothetical protein
MYLFYVLWQVDYVESRWGWSRIPMVLLPLAIALINLVLAYRLRRRTTVQRWSNSEPLLNLITLLASTGVVWSVIAYGFMVPLGMGGAEFEIAGYTRGQDDQGYATFQELMALYKITIGNFHYLALFLILDVLMVFAGNWSMFGRSMANLRRY